MRYGCEHTMPRLMRQALIVMAAVALCDLAAAQPPEAVPLAGVWGPSTPPRAMMLVGDRLVVAGDFDYIGPPTGTFAIADAADGRITVPGRPVSDPVIDMASDGAGGWYVLLGHRYSPTLTTLVHLRADGTRDSTWTPPAANRRISGVLRAGGHLLIKGGFSTVNGAPRYGVAALDPASGAVRPWNAQLQPGFADAGVIVWAEDGGRVYVGGDFVSAGGLPRQSLAVLDAVTGATLPSTFPAAAWFEVDQISAAGGRVYLNWLCGADLCGYSSDGTLLPGWRLYLLFGQRGPRVVTPTRIYVAGIHGHDPAYRIRAFDAVTGEALPWQTPPLERSFGVQDLAVDGNRLIAVGNIASVGSARGGRVVAFDLNSGDPLPWRPQVGGTITRVLVDGTQVALGGDFASAGGIEKRGLAAIDLTTGRPAAVQPPDVDGRVDALARSGDLIVAGGGDRLVGFSATTGARIAEATVAGTVSALAFSDSTLYIGGAFSSLFGTPRRNLGAFDLQAGRVTAFDPQPDGTITRLIESSGAIYAVGSFQSVPGYGRDGVAAFDARDGSLLTFSTASDGPVHDVAFYRDRVLLAGVVGPNTYSTGTKWVDRVTGQDVPLGRPAPFVANAAGRTGDTVVVGGAPTPGYANAGLTAIDARTGGFLTWAPQLSGLLSLTAPYVQSIIGSPRYVAIGGDFQAADGQVVQNLVIYPAGRAGAPRRMTAAVSSSTVTVGWQPGSPAAAAYVLDAGTAPGASDIGTFALGTLTRVTGALPPGTYFLRVTGVGPAGVGLTGSEVVVTVPATSTAPQAPGGLTAVVAGNALTLRWSAASGNATTYMIEAGTAPGLSNIGAFATGDLDTSFATAAPPGTYYVRVRAANAFGVSAATNEVTVVVP